MLFKVLADITVLLHFIWILFLILGVFLGVRYRIARIIHISGLAYAIIMQIFGWYCPLTHLEVWLRLKHDPSVTYGGSFIINYAEKLIYIELSSTSIFILTILLIGFNVWFYRRKK
jgi:hypothetical protein